jgi:hypothetical protein
MQCGDRDESASTELSRRQLIPGHHLVHEGPPNAQWLGSFRDRHEDGPVSSSAPVATVVRPSVPRAIAARSRPKSTARPSSSTSAMSMVTVIRMACAPISRPSTGIDALSPETSPNGEFPLDRANRHPNGSRPSVSRPGSGVVPGVVHCARRVATGRRTNFAARRLGREYFRE